MNLGPDGTWTPEEMKRAQALAAVLRERSSAPLLAARAPGRVNLIGEHTDYSNLPVLPAAIDRSTVVVAARRRDGVVSATNINSWFTARAFELRNQIAPFEAGDWGNYIKAAAQGLVTYSRALGRRTNLKGIDLIVDGQVPVAAGLSSSAALTVALTLAMAAVNEIETQQLELAQLAARSERYVGTMAGGMDRRHRFWAGAIMRFSSSSIPCEHCRCASPQMRYWSSPTAWSARTSRESFGRSTTGVWSNVPSRRGS